jgi:hypothetical protein
MRLSFQCSPLRAERLAPAALAAIQKLITAPVAHHASDLGRLDALRFAEHLLEQRLALERFLQSPVMLDPVAACPQASTPHPLVTDPQAGQIGPGADWPSKSCSPPFSRRPS